MTLVGKTLSITRSFFLILFVLLLVPPSFYHQPVAGLDASWNIALHLAFKYHLVFGKDFVFTYGPLGILHTRHPIAIDLFVYLLFDLYLLGSIFFLGRKIFRDHFGPGIILYGFFAIVLVMYDSPDEWCFFLLVFYLLFFIKTTSRKTYLCQSVLFSLLSFYIKISLGVIGVFILFAGITYLFIRRKISLMLWVVTAISFVVLLWLTARLLHVDLLSYWVTSLKLINDYNDAMFRILSQQYVIYLLAALLIIAMPAAWSVYRIAGFIRQKKLREHSDEVFVYFVVGVSLFVLFKSGFVRAEDHFHVFFKGATLFAVILYVFSPVQPGQRITALICWATLIISFVSVSTIPGSYHPYSKLTDFSFFPNRAEEIKRYLVQIFQYNQAREESDKLDSSQNALKKIIGNGTVDIMPSEISKIYFAGLRYNPRPVIQSYAVYDQYLDSLNYQKYMSESAPDYVLCSVNSIDGRYPFFDESRTKLALMSRYRIVARLDDLLVMGKKTVVQTFSKTDAAGIQDIKFGEDIPIRRTADLQYAKISVEYSMWGKIQRFFYHPPALWITFTFEDGTAKTFQAIKPILADGGVINKYVENTQDFQLLMQSNGQLSASVKKIRIGPDPVHSGFKDQITMEITRFPFSDKTEAERQTDSLSIADLLHQYKPLPIDSLTLKEDSIAWDIRNFNTYSPIVEMSGWAFRANASNEGAIIKTVLQSKDFTYELPSVQEERTDVAEHFNRADLHNTGFTSTVSTSQMAPGDYRMGIVITYKDSLTKWVRFSMGNHLLVRSNYSPEKLKSIDAVSANSDALPFYIGTVEDNNGQVLVDGWAFIRHADSRQAKTNLILQGPEGIFRINTDAVRRDDLISSFKNPLLGFGGFSCIIPKDHLPPGVYTIGIEVSCCHEKNPVWRLSDKTIKVAIH
jgi:hypothetical protein